MKPIIKKSLSILIAISLTLLISNNSVAAVQVPDNIRVGLYYSNTAVTSFKVNADKGLQLGCFDGSNFNMLYDEPTNSVITLRKDAYYASNNGILSEYQLTDKAIPDGDKLGPFHIQIGGDYSDYQSAETDAQNLIQQGVNVYLAFTGAWEIWTGFYSDQISAQADIDNNFRLLLDQSLYNLTIIDDQLSKNRIVAQNSNGNIIFIFAYTEGILQIKPDSVNDPDVLKLNGKSRYRGNIEVRRLSGSDMTIINVLPLEQYLYGVVPSEIETSSGIEALKAQAVAARTYAMNTMNKHSKYLFNLCATTDCQVYGGFDKENIATNKSVDDTKGKIVTYNGKPALIYFFCSDGGRTEDCTNVWSGDYPYLKSVEDKYESDNSTNYNWKQTLTSDKIKSIMKGKSYDIGDITGIEVNKLSDAGRPIEMIIEGTKGTKTFKKESCRTIFSLPSQLFTITTDADTTMTATGKKNIVTQLGSVKVLTADGLKTLTSVNNNITIVSGNGNKKSVPVIPKTYTFTGKGWGHAVGMSQEGAKGMAKQGFTYDQILTYYFTGTKVE